jgi:hypothetical protein
VAGRPADGEAGAPCVPIAADVARFWITRLHGPDANDSAAVRSLGIAAQQLSEGDEAGAQKALDASGLTRLSPDGVVLMRAVAGSLGIGPLDLPWWMPQGFGARKISKRICLCSRTMRQRHCSPRRHLWKTRRSRFLAPLKGEGSSGKDKIVVATPGLISLVNAPPYPSANRLAPPAQVPGLIGTIGSVSGAPMWILGGSFKGIFWFAQRPQGTLNSGDYYFDVTRGCMLVTDGTGAWFNPISPALPPY